MRERILFIYNPLAGKGKIANNLSEIVATLSKLDIELVIYATSGRLDAKKKACEYASEELCDRIVCAGGDGTMNEVTSGVLESGKKVPIGFIPIGSTNDLGHTLGIPSDAKGAALYAVTHQYSKSDIATMNGRYFTYTASFGSIADVSYNTPQNAKNALGRLAYLMSGIAKFPNLKVVHARVEYDDKVIEDDFVHGMIVNSDSVGGFKGLMGEDVELDDGIYEMILVRKPKHKAGLTVAVNELLNHKFENAQYVVYAKIKSMKVITESPLAWSLDGEYGGETTEAVFEVHERAVDYVRSNTSNMENSAEE